MPPAVKPGTSQPSADVVGRTFHAGYPDLATPFPVCGPVEPGDVLVTDANRPGTFCRSALAEDRGVVGVVSGAPGVLLGDGAGTEASERLSAPVVSSGVVLVHADAGYGPIAMNDLLVTSPTAGHVMRAEDPPAGTVVGKALEPLDAGTGLIRVLVMLR